MPASAPASGVPALDGPALGAALGVAARQVETGTVPWLVLGIARRNGPATVRAWSRPDLPRVGAGALAAIASVTKPIVATAVMQLVEEGRLVLRAPLAEVLPGLADRRITAWHVLAHRSGLADLDAAGLVLTGRAGALRDRVLAQVPDDEPGSLFRYASSPFELLGLALEALDGEPLPAVLRRRVLAPLGMTATAFDPAALPGARPAPVWVPAWDPARPGPPPPEGARMGAALVPLALAGGGLWSTAGDLLRFGRAMLGGGELDGTRVLAPATLSLMTRETTDRPAPGTDPLRARHYGLGWGLPGPDAPGSREAFGHGGIAGTRLWIDPANDLVLVYLTGSWGMGAAPIDAVFGAVYAALR